MDVKDNETKQVGSSSNNSDLLADVYLNCQSEHQQFWVFFLVFLSFYRHMSELISQIKPRIPNLYSFQSISH
jgi:hypothetical protein